MRANKRQKHLYTFSSFFIKMPQEGWAVFPQTTLILTIFFLFRTYPSSVSPGPMKALNKEKHLPILPPVDWCPVDREWLLALPWLDWSLGTAPLLSAVRWGGWRIATSPSHLSTRGNSPSLPVKGSVLEQNHRHRPLPGDWSQILLRYIYILWSNRYWAQINVCFHYFWESSVPCLHVDECI